MIQQPYNSPRFWVKMSVVIDWEKYLAQQPAGPREPHILSHAKLIWIFCNFAYDNLGVHFIFEDGSKQQPQKRKTKTGIWSVMRSKIVLFAPLGGAFELGQTALGRIPHWGGSFREWSIHSDVGVGQNCLCVCIKYVCIYSYLFVYYSLPKTWPLDVQDGNWFLFIPVQQGLCVSMAVASIALVIPKMSQGISCMFVFLHSALLGLGSNCILHISYQFIS